MMAKKKEALKQEVPIEEEETTEEKQEFTNENVRYVNMRDKSKSTKNAVAFGTLLVFLIIPVVLIVGLVIAISNSGGSNSESSNSGSPNSGESNSGCYIATMSYGSYDAPQVLVLREFRDRFLQKFGAGRAFIAWYYKNSPSFVQKHKNKKWLHAVLRLPLNAFVFVLTPIYSGRNAKKLGFRSSYKWQLGLFGYFRKKQSAFNQIQFRKNKNNCHTP